MLVEVTLLLFIIFLSWHRWARSYWRRRGVYSENAEFIFGHTRPVLFNYYSVGEFFEKIYTKHKDKKVVGIYNMYEPQLVVTDLDLVQQVMATDFNSFSKSGLLCNPEVDPLLYVNPFVRTGDEWRTRRAMVVANHTNVKIKDYAASMVKTGQLMVNYVRQMNGQALNIMDIGRSYTIDNVCYIVYGYEPTAFTDENNVFKKYAGHTLFHERIDRTIKFIHFFHRLHRLLKLRFFSMESHDFFMSNAKKILEFRKKTDVTRNDFIDYLLKKSEGHLSETELAGHLLTIYADSVETSSTLLSFLLLEVANRDEVQERLREEIRAAGTKPEDFDFDKLNSLVYLDMVFNETLRMHPPFLFLSRFCTNSTKLGEYEIEEGTKVFLPYNSIVNDPDYFEAPEKFNPERFAPENFGDTARKAFTPFGNGPRKCPGMKYATLQIKLAVVFLLFNFRIRPVIELKGNKIPSSFRKVIVRPSEEERLVFELIQT